jgi:hypothetical protein
MNEKSKSQRFGQPWLDNKHKREIVRQAPLEHRPALLLSVWHACDLIQNLLDTGHKIHTQPQALSLVLAGRVLELKQCSFAKND